MSGTEKAPAEGATTPEETTTVTNATAEAAPAVARSSAASQLDRNVLGSIRAMAREAPDNLRWLHENVPDVFLSTMREEPEVIHELVTDLRRLRHDRQLILADREDELTVALLDV